MHSNKAKETLLEQTDFNYEEANLFTNVRQSTETAESYVTDGEAPSWSTCESKNARYTANLKTERFQEPRMFTMEQIRNISSAVLNQSTLNDRMQLSETRYVKTYNTCLELDETDKFNKEEYTELDQKM